MGGRQNSIMLGFPFWANCCKTMSAQNVGKEYQTSFCRDHESTSNKCYENVPVAEVILFQSFSVCKQVGKLIVN